MKHVKPVLFLLLLSVFVLGLAACGQTSGAGQTEKSKESAAKEEKNAGAVNVYTTRHYDTDAELYKKFTEETGINVNVISGKDELIQRLKDEGDATEADVFITADAGNLARLKADGLTQSIESDVLTANIPEKLRDQENHWFGLTKRARVIVYSKDRVKPSELSTYEALTEDAWKGRVLIRSSENIYNQSLLASFIELNGEKEAKKWAKGMVANMARTPEGGDTDQIKAIAAGEGDVAVSNTYYVGRLLNSADPEEAKIGEQVGVFFPDQDTNGTHINISGAAVVKNAKNADNAVKFMEFLTGTKAQELFAEGNNEYPVNPEAKISETLSSWGEFKEQDINLSVLGENNTRAIQLFNEVGWK
ncbi:extracellular solute-binding protein [Bacillus mangrovi]|uniref:Extracellular solute-binding protein n=1 Tax=Metabacillus mangrovi TaxID=1491830 RepID=A0A7X2S5I4_9BACI|nr:Fe(3+) ABC transporter substrate-binding protein [Metabacillus mangrovi]MTH54078.1 extracellular solute-binding protein [Metabacillus mangrovi]